MWVCVYGCEIVCNCLLVGSGFAVGEFNCLIQFSTSYLSNKRICSHVHKHMYVCMYVNRGCFQMSIISSTRKAIKWTFLYKHVCTLIEHHLRQRHFLVSRNHLVRFKLICGETKKFASHLQGIRVNFQPVGSARWSSYRKLFWKLTNVCTF